MKISKINVLLLSVLLLVSSCPNEGDNDNEPPSVEVVSALGFASSMKIGWNLGNTMEAHSNLTPGETAWGNPIVTQALMKGVAARGFGAVRIPVTWGTMIGDAPDYKINESWLSRVAEIAGYAGAAGMKAIINIHHDGADSRYWLSVKTADLAGEKKTNIDAKFKAVWTQIAEKFKNSGNYLLFEGFNELHDGSWGNGNAAQHSRINELNQIFVDTVRAAGGENGERFLIVHGWVTRPSVTVSSLVIPTDSAKDRIIVGIHFYDPYDFTGSAKQNKWGEKALPGNWANEKNVRDTFNSVKAKFIDKGIPVIIGEYGAVNQKGDGFAYRKYYMEYVTKYAVECSLIPFYWDNGGFGSGGEKFGLLKRADGSPYDSDAAEILAVMMKAVNQDYSAESIAAP
jgi:aryl-phospho-beta-D-glucosidase BglC (GH1 family)